MKFSTAPLVALTATIPVEASLRQRQLEFTPIRSYVPLTLVTDEAAIDLDQREIEELTSGDNPQWAAAQNVYENGGHSHSFAEITLGAALTGTLAQGAAVSGTSVDGGMVKGVVMAEANPSDETVIVMYEVSDDFANHVGCQVGGSSEPVTGGCFAATGNIDVAGTSYAYTAVANKNGRSIQSLTVDNGQHHVGGNPDNAYYPEMANFVEYYGTSDYADKWVLAAFTADRTEFSTGRGNADFVGSNFDGRHQSIKKGTVYQTMVMSVFSALEGAVESCRATCDEESCQLDDVHSLDKAVAYYTGSILVVDSNKGAMPFALGESRCAQFATCNGDISSVNERVLARFTTMQTALQNDDCDTAETIKDEIVSLIYVPIVQGALRYAHKGGPLNDQTQKIEAEGAAFAAAVLPKVYKCDPEAANTIYLNLKIDEATPVDFPAVKSAFEGVYSCMKITCADVGGQIDSETGTYYAGAEPCGSQEESSDDDVAGTGNTDGSAGYALGVGFAAAGSIVATLFSLI